MDTMEPRRFSLEELAALSGLPPRTVRFYMQAGLVDRPEGAKRGAWYEARHLEQLLAVRRWQAAGLSLERIRELQAGERDGGGVPPAARRAGTVEVWSHVVLGEGLELVVEPARAGLTPAQLRRLARECVRICAQIQVEGDEA